MRKTVFIISIVFFFGCTSKDDDIKQSIAVNAKEELMFAGVNYSVSKGIVTLTGNCPSEELRNKLVKRLQATGGVEKVVDSISIGPVLLDNDFVLKQKVDSVLAGYAMVQSQVKNGVVTLNGEIQKKKMEKLGQSIHRLAINNVVNNLFVKESK